MSKKINYIVVISGKGGNTHAIVASIEGINKTDFVEKHKRTKAFADPSKVYDQLKEAFDKNKTLDKPVPAAKAKDKAKDKA